MHRVMTLLIIILLTAAPFSAWGGPKAVVFVVSSVSLDELTAPDLPHFQKVLSTGSVGLMNVRTAGTPKGESSETGMEAACLTIGAGTRAVGGEAVREAFNAYEELDGVSVSKLWSARTLRSETAAEVLNPRIARIAADNRAANHVVSTGALGSSLHAAGLRTGVIGNADIPGARHREAAAIVMDENGLVDYGDVGKRLYMRDPAAPFGVTSNPGAYLKAIDRIWLKADLVVVDPGDTLRASLYAGYCTPDQAANLVSQAVRKTDNLLGELLNRIDLKKDLLVIIAPGAPAGKSDEGRLLAPVIIAGQGFSKGLLISDSTRWAGLVTNADIAPTILSFFDLTVPSSMVGRPGYTVPENDSITRIKQIDESLALRTRRQVIARWLALAFTVIVIVVTTAAVYTRRRGYLLTWLTLFPGSATLAALCVPLLGSMDLAASALAILAVSALISAVSLRVWRCPLKALGALSLLLSLLISLDLVSGSRLLRDSVLSYSPSEGARYYGLGNEYMGVMIGATIIGTGILFSQWNPGLRLKQFLILLILGAAVIVIGAPFLGTNTGGVMSIIPAALVMLRLRSGKQIRLIHIVGIGLAITAGVLLLITADALKQSGQSHMGRLGSAIASGGIQQFLQVAERKIVMNLNLLASSLWSRLLMAGAAALVVLRIKGVWKSSEMYAAFTGSVVGAVAAFVFNDSGVVAAALCLLYPWALSAAIAVKSSKAED